MLRWLDVPAPRMRAMVDSFWAFFADDAMGDMMCVWMCEKGLQC